MADVTPFKAMRYRADIALDDVVAPPYDVLSAAQAAELRARSPYNVVHVDLPVPPGEKADDAAYARAARTLRRWRADGVLVRDEQPGIVVVDQTFSGPDGRERTRRGFIARLRLTSLDDRVVLPHERTHAGPKVDRLRLYRATHTDLSQVFMLFPDDDGSAGALLDRVPEQNRYGIGLTQGLTDNLTLNLNYDSYDYTEDPKELAIAVARAFIKRGRYPPSSAFSLLAFPDNAYNIGLNWDVSEGIGLNFSFGETETVLSQKLRSLSVGVTHYGEHFDTGINITRSFSTEVTGDRGFTILPSSDDIYVDFRLSKDF